MAHKRNIIAVIFDFDDTLSNDSTTLLLKEHGIDTDKFWKEEVEGRVSKGWNPTQAYLDLILDYTGEGKPLGKLSNRKLRDFGSKLEIYSGINELHKDLKDICSLYEVNPKVEFFIISGGLEEIIKGCNISKLFTEIWGCTFHEENGCICKIKDTISFTEKTKYLFVINKGFHKDIRKKPYIVNEEIDLEDRRVPFENMIYIGDGLTDVPCFSLIKKMIGKPRNKKCNNIFGVLDKKRQKKEDNSKTEWLLKIAPDRVDSHNSAAYGPKDDLGFLIRSTVDKICRNLNSEIYSAL